MTTTKTRQIEFIAALSIPEGSTSSIETIALRFEDATLTAISKHPAIAAYFVQPVPALGEVHVGFRFEDVSDEGIEGWAEEVLSEAIDLFKSRGRLGSASNLKREDTTLQIS